MVMPPMEVVKQTGNTIVFEEFNKEKMDLVTLLTRDDQELPLEKFKNALMGKKEDGTNSDFVVKSFDEFVQKFAPTIYETVVKTGENSAQFVYGLEKPKYDCKEIQLKDHAFYKMIMNMVDRKANTDKGNLEFPYEDLKKALTPEAEMDDCKRIRKNLQSNITEYRKLLESGASSVEIGRYVDNIMALRDKVRSKYENKSPLALLPLLIADKQSQLDKINTVLENSQNSSEANTIPCNYIFDEQGNLILIEQSVSDDIEVLLDKSSENTELIEALKDDFREFAPPAIKENDYISNLVVNVFAPEGTVQLTTQNKYELEEMKKQYQDLYKSSLESFAKAVSTVVEKFVGMKTFFDHATYDGELPKDVSVIIANCKVDAILNDVRAKQRFKKYFSALSLEKDVNKIWFGIIPAISYKEDNVGNIERRERINPFARRTSESETEKRNTTGLVSLEAAKEMLALLTETKIMTFVNYKASEKTGFSELTKERIEGYEKDFESVNSEYAVFTYPNFTILPKEKNAVKIGDEYDKQKNREIGSYIEIPGVYLESSYVAAGMMVGIQNYKFLRSKNFLVKPQYPCVRFDIEEGENAKIILTKLNRETTTEMEKKTKDAIMEKRFGFVFADNKVIYDGHVINNSYVMNVRSLKMDKNNKYKNLYKTLVKNLVDQILRTSSDNITRESVKRFIEDYVEDWKTDNKDDARKYANRILLKGESIDLDLEKHKISVIFNKEVEIWDDIAIEDTESEE